MADKGWGAADSGGHPLDVASGQRLGETTILVLLGPKNRFGANYFQIFLLGRRGQASEQPVVIGLYSSGRYLFALGLTTALLSGIFIYYSTFTFATERACCGLESIGRYR